MFNAVAVVSLLLCVGTTFLWIRSFFRLDQLQRYDPASREFKYFAAPSIMNNCARQNWQNSMA